MRQRMEFEHVEVPSQREIALGYYEQIRATERFEVGEDIEFGPGYAQCIAHYFNHELGVARPNNLLLDQAAELLNLPRDRTVPILTGSLEPGRAQSGIVEPEQVVPLSYFIDAVVCRSAEDAQRLRNLGPSVLPHILTQNALDLMQRGTTIPHPDFPRERAIESAQEEKDFLRWLASAKAPFRFEQVSVHLGSEEVIRSICRLMQESHAGPWRAFVPLPNYSNALRSMTTFGGEVVTSPQPSGVTEWAADIAKLKPNLVYLSNPNNPLGTILELDELTELLEATPEEAMFVLDEVSIDLQKPVERRGHALATQFPKRRIVIVDSESKRSALTSWRIGYGYCTRNDDMVALWKLEPPFVAPGVKSP